MTHAGDDVRRRLIACGSATATATIEISPKESHKAENPSASRPNYAALEHILYIHTHTNTYTHI